MFQKKGIEYVEKAVHMFQDSDVIDREINGDKAQHLEIKHDVSDNVEYPIEKVPKKRKKRKIRWLEGCGKDEDHCLCCKQFPRNRTSTNLVKKTDTEKYKCFFCDLILDNSASRKNHVEKEHEDRKRKGLNGHWRYQCNYCYYESKIALFIYNHEMLCPKNIIFKCEMCDFGAPSKTSFTLHMKNIHQTDIPIFKRQPKPLFKCSFCEYKTNGKGQIQIHISMKHSQNTIQCDLCPFQTTQSRALVRHQITNNVSTFQCQVCSFQTQSKLGFINHMKVHENVSNFQCEVCSYQTNSQLGFQSHRTSHDKGMVKCIKCDYESATIMQMITHKKIHTENYQINEPKCEQCAFSHQGRSLQFRIKQLHLHRCDPFKCEYCDYESNLKSFVSQHKTNNHQNEI